MTKVNGNLSTEMQSYRILWVKLGNGAEQDLAEPRLDTVTPPFTENNRHTQKVRQ